MGTNKFTARLAGFLYLIVVVTGMFSLAYVPSKLSVTGDTAKTVQNIAESEWLFRSGILSSVICYLAFLLLPFVLYKLLGHLDTIAAKIMVVFAVISVPMSLLNLQNRYGILSLIGGTDAAQIQAQAAVLLNDYSNGILFAQIFWGLWLLPFGYLVFRSGFLPRVFGVLLMLGCFGYLLNFVGRTMIADFGMYAISRYVTIPAALGEIGICLWLLVRGINEQKINSFGSHSEIS